MVSARLADGEVFDSAKLKNTVRFLIENDMRNVVIDLGNLEYLYSDTINAFIASNRHMLEVSGRIAILTEHPKVQDILKRAGLDNIMRIYRSEAEMIADSKEILRQTSSYRIEELQKISNQPAEQPAIPKTEFDEFKAEMGQRLGSKLDNNELPQYQLGVPQNGPATPSYQAPVAPAETAYPAFNPPGFGNQSLGEQPAPGFPQGQPAPAYNYNNQPFGMGNAAPTFPNQGQQGFGQPQANFDFPTVQLPVGQFGNLSQPTAPTAPQSSNHGTPTPPAPPAGYDPDTDSDPRQRKSSQDRMRSPNARKQQGRRVGGREFPGQDDENVPVYAEEKIQEAPSQGDKFGGYNLPPATPNSLAEEARGPAKLIVLMIFVVAAAAGIWYYLHNNTQPETTPIETPSVPAPQTPEAVTPAPAPVVPGTPEPAVPVTPAPTAVQPAPSVPVAPVAPAPTPAPEVKPKPIAETPKPPAPTPKPEPKPPKVAAIHPKPQVKPPRAEKPEKPAPSPEETAPAPKPGMLHITSEPSGAEVLVNFSKKGSTPLDVSLSNNSNKIIVRLAGYKRFETTLPKNSPEHDLQVDLEKEESSEPAAKAKPEPERRVEPKPEPKQPEEDNYKEPEDLPIKAQAPQREREREPEPAPEPKHSASAPTPGDGPIGIIFLSSSPARADIVIDGKNTGKKTPAKIELPSGQHRIEMSKSGQKASVDQLVNEGKNKALHLTLQ